MTFKKFILDNFTPWNLNEWYKKKKHIKALGNFELVNKNIELKNNFTNKKCFLIGSGPSLKNLSLKGIKEEYIIYLNHGYLHPDYQFWNKSIHFNSGLSIHRYTKEGEVKFYKVLEEKTNDIFYLINSNDYCIIKIIIIIIKIKIIIIIIKVKL